LKNYKKFINESLRDKMKPKNIDDVINQLPDELNKRMELILKYEIDDKDVLDDIDKRIDKKISEYTKKYLSISETVILDKISSIIKMDNIDDVSKSLKKLLETEYDIDNFPTLLEYTIFFEWDKLPYYIRKFLIFYFFDRVMIIKFVGIEEFKKKYMKIINKYNESLRDKMSPVSKEEAIGNVESFVDSIIKRYEGEVDEEINSVDPDYMIIPELMDAIMLLYDFKSYKELGILLMKKDMISDIDLKWSIAMAHKNKTDVDIAIKERIEDILQDMRENYIYDLIEIIKNNK